MRQSLKSLNYQLMDFIPLISQWGFAEATLRNIKKTDFAAGRAQRLNALLLVFSGKQWPDIQNRYLGEIKTS